MLPENKNKLKSSRTLENKNNIIGYQSLANSSNAGQQSGHSRQNSVGSNLSKGKSKIINYKFNTVPTKSRQGSTSSSKLEQISSQIK
jgi:hypothetical protein